MTSESPEMELKEDNECLWIRMRTVNTADRSITEASCETEDHKVALRFFSDLLKCHWTGFNDFEEFRCEFSPVTPVKVKRKEEMICYILDFSTTEGRITVHRQDDGSYVVTKHGKEDCRTGIATCTDFADAYAVFHGHLTEMADDMFTKELGK